MHEIENIDGAANTDVSSENNSILLTENGEGTVQLEHNIGDTDGAANTDVNSEKNLKLLTLSTHLEHKTEDIDGVVNTNANSENNSKLLTENEKSMVELKDNIEDIDRTANSLLLTENIGSTVKLSMKSYCYTWTINNFFKCLNFCLLEQSADIHFNFNSPSFILENTEWRLHLSVITVSEKSNSKVEGMNIVLESKSNIASDLYIKNEVRIVDDDGQVLLACSPKKIVGIGNRKEYSYSFLPLRGSKTFVLPYKLIVRNEFSTLISKTCEDTGSSCSKSDNQNVAESECCAKDAAASIPPPPKHSTRRSVLPRIRPTSWPSLERLGAEMWEFRIPILVVLCVSLVLVSLVDQDDDAIPTIQSDKINHIIYDCAKKLNHISEALNLTILKDKSKSESLLSKMYNSTDHEMQITDSADHEMQITDSADHEMQRIDSTDHEMQITDSADHEMQSTDSTDHVMQCTDSTDHVMPVIDSNISQSIASNIRSFIASKKDSNKLLNLASKISSFVASKVKPIFGYEK